MDRKKEIMRIQELKQMVGRECEFLSYYIEEYEKDIATNPSDMELKTMLSNMKSKWEAYDKVYRFICKTIDEPNAYQNGTHS